MKGTISIFLTILTTSIFTFGQITTTKVAPPVKIIVNTRYDSTQNFLGNEVNKYIGQELYLLGKQEGLEKYGYQNFYTNYVKGRADNPVYKCCDSYNSKYDDLNGKYFKVIGIVKNEKDPEINNFYNDEIYLKLEEKISKDIVYFY
jgi:hypothetical protein